MINKKRLALAAILPLFFTACQASSDNLVEVMLVSTIDESRGYCLDIAGGKGARAPIDKGLQAHTCYNYTGEILEDQGFVPELINQGQFKISYFDVCMSASSLTQGASLDLAKCDQSQEQLFSLKSNGHLIVQKEPELCVTVNGTKKKEGRGGSPVHVMRPLSLELCNDAKADYQKWSVKKL